MQNAPDPAVPLIAVLPIFAVSFCVWLRLQDWAL